MSKQFVVGMQYKLVDASKDADTAIVVGAGTLQLPEVFTCNAVGSYGDCHSITEGVKWCGEDVLSGDNEGWMCASFEALQAGAFEEVVDGQ